MEDQADITAHADYLKMRNEGNCSTVDWLIRVHLYPCVKGSRRSVIYYLLIYMFINYTVHHAFCFVMSQRSIKKFKLYSNRPISLPKKQKNRRGGRLCR